MTTVFLIYRNPRLPYLLPVERLAHDLRDGANLSIRQPLPQRRLVDAVQLLAQLAHGRARLALELW